MSQNSESHDKLHLLRKHLSSADELQLDAEQDDASAPEGFAITDARSANWLVLQITQARAYAERVTAWAAAEISRSQRQEQRLLDHFGSQLEAWVTSELRERGGRRKSVALPGGTVGFRTAPRRLEFIDEGAALQWSRSHLPDAVKVVVETTGEHAERLERWLREESIAASARSQLLRNVLCDHFRHTGELPDGATVGGGGESLFIK